MVAAVNQMKTYYTTICNNDGDNTEKFIGSVIVKAEDKESARLKVINIILKEKGVGRYDAISMIIPKNEEPDNKYYNKLLTEQELKEIWPNEVMPELYILIGVNIIQPKCHILGLDKDKQELESKIEERIKERIKESDDNITYTKIFNMIDIELYSKLQIWLKECGMTRTLAYEVVMEFREVLIQLFISAVSEIYWE